MYQLVYPTFPARLRHSDAVYHLVSDFLTAIICNSDRTGRQSHHLGSSVIILLLLPSLLSTNTCPASSVARGFKLLKHGQTMLWNSSNQTTTTQSFGASTSRGIFRITPKLVDIKRYVTLTSSITSNVPPLNIWSRWGGVFSSQIPYWKSS